MSTPRPKISVIVAAYNAAPFVAECIESIIGQDFSDWQLIVVDDGSTDSTPDIVGRYASADSRITLLRFENGGLSTARNRGLDAAVGDYVMFCDADDAYSPHAMSLLCSAIGSNDIAVGQYVEAQVNPFAAGAHCRRLPRVTPKSGADALIDTLYQRPTAHNSVCAKLFRRSLFDIHRFADGSWYEDLEITSRIYAASASIAFTTEPVYFYRINESSFLHTWSPRRLDVLKITGLIVDRAAKSGSVALQRAALSRRFSACFNMFLLAGAAGEEAVANQCWDEIRRLRFKIMSDPSTRIKNKAGAIVSLLGRRITALVNQLSNRS